MTCNNMVPEIVAEHYAFVLLISMLVLECRTKKFIMPVDKCISSRPIAWYTYTNENNYLSSVTNVHTYT